MTDKMQKKVKELYSGGENLSRRAAFSAIAALALAFLLFFYSPLMAAYTKRNYVNFGAPEVVKYCLFVTAAAFFGMWLVSSLIGGKIHEFLLNMLTGFVAASLIQLLFLNIDFDLRDGQSIPWHTLIGKSVGNLLIWIAILLLPFLLAFFSKKIRNWFLVLISLAAIIVPGIRLVPVLKDESARLAQIRDTYELDYSDPFQYASGKNILVYLLDGVSNAKLDKAVADFPGTLENYWDFTRYMQMPEKNSELLPALGEFLTGKAYDGSGENYSEYFAEAWESSDFYANLLNEGWSVVFYLDPIYAAGSASNLVGKVSNLKENDGAYSIRKSGLVKLFKAGVFDCLPMALKSSFYVDAADLTDLKVNGADEWNWLEAVKGYWSAGSGVGEKTNRLAVYAFDASSMPYMLDENGHPDERKKEVQEQVAGVLRFIAEQMQCLKDFKRYDDTTIIIISARGDTYSEDGDLTPILLVKPAGIRQPEMAISEEPIMQNSIPGMIQDGVFEVSE